MPSRRDDGGVNASLGDDALDVLVVKFKMVVASADLVGDQRDTGGNTRFARPILPIDVPPTPAAASAVDHEAGPRAVGRPASPACPS